MRPLLSSHDEPWKACAVRKHVTQGAVGLTDVQALDVDLIELGVVRYGVSLAVADGAQAAASPSHSVVMVSPILDPAVEEAVDETLRAGAVC